MANIIISPIDISFFRRKTTPMTRIYPLSFGLFFASTLLAHAGSCKVDRTAVFSKATIPSLPQGSQLPPAVLGSPLASKNGMIMVPLDARIPGYLFVGKKGVGSNFFGIDPSEMGDYRPKLLLDGRIAAGSKNGQIRFFNATGRLVLIEVAFDGDSTVSVSGQLRNGDVLIRSKKYGQLFRDLDSGGANYFYQDEFDYLTRSYANIQEFSDGHIFLGGTYADLDGIRILNLDGSNYFSVPVTDFLPNPVQSATELSNGIVAIAGSHTVPGSAVVQNGFAMIDLPNKKVTFMDFGAGSLTFVEKMPSGSDYLVGFINADHVETLRYINDKGKVWENSEKDFTADFNSNPDSPLASRVSLLSDGTIVNLVGLKAQFFSPNGTLKGVFDFSGLDIDPFTHQLQTPEGPMMVLPDDTVVVQQSYYEGIRLSYLKLSCD